MTKNPTLTGQQNIRETENQYIVSAKSYGKERRNWVVDEVF